jgi:hypothetical protein
MAKRVGAPHQVAAMMKGNKKGGRRWVERSESNALEERRRAADVAFLLLNCSKLTGKGGNDE